MSHVARLCALLCLFLVSAGLKADPRAWLEPDRIALGETTTLHLETDSASAGTPDLSALEQDFDVRGQSSSTRMSMANWRTESRTTWKIVLEPRTTGVFTVPALAVGGGTTRPLSLTVVAGTPGSAQRGDDIYFDVTLGTRDPYVQQAVPYTVRLYYAIALADGGVEIKAPEHASLQQVGEDQTGEQFIGGRRYAVFERRYLLTPEQSGPMTLPQARFSGHARGNDGFGMFGRLVPVSQIGPAESLDVRPQPANAPSPWLVASQLTLTRGDVAMEVRAGEPLMVELKLNAQGAAASQLPELKLPPIPGAQVFPEPPQSKESFVDGQVEATVTRRFAVVAAQAGTLRLPAVQVNYWNVTSDQAEAATVPALDVSVTPGVGAQASSPPAEPAASAGEPATATQPAGAAPADTGALRLWQALAAVLALAFALALAWGWRRGHVPAPATPERTLPGAPTAASSPTSLQRALAGNDLRRMGDALRATTSPPCLTIGALRARLADPDQRAALDALERSLWAENGDEADRTRALLRAAFRNGPRFTTENAGADQAGLPPLYPPRPRGSA